MGTHLAVSAFFAISLWTLSTFGRPPDDVVAKRSDPKLDAAWSDFKTKFNKDYKTTDEESKRRATFERTLASIDEHNAEAANGEHSFTLGLNHLADFTPEEVNRLYKGFRSNRDASENGGDPFVEVRGPLPASMDWRTKGYVTPVKNQGQCGSCWTFSATGAMEGQYFRQTGQLVSLSEQQLVDCSAANQGCNGGLPSEAFKYIAERGLVTEASYPYLMVNSNEQNMSCRFRAGNVVVTSTGHVQLPSGSEQALKQALATVGPVSIGVDASSSKFMSYRNGLYEPRGCSTDNLDHAVLAVGYTSVKGVDAYIIKNSWGPSWGDRGYFYIRMGRNNICGVATDANYPTVSNANNNSSSSDVFPSNCTCGCM